MISDEIFKYLLSSIGADPDKLIPPGSSESTSSEPSEIEKLKKELAEKDKKLEKLNEELRTIKNLFDDKETECQLLRIQNGLQDVVIGGYEERLEEAESYNSELKKEQPLVELEDRICLICQEDNPKCETCKRRYHQECLSRWVLEGRPNCPACDSQMLHPTEN